MAEVRVSHVVLVAIPVVLGGCLVAICAGYFAIPPFEVAGFKFGGLNQKQLQSVVDQGSALASGYKPAKSAQEAMDQFHKAIDARQYKYAALYTTRPYADQLTRAHDAAFGIGDRCERILYFASQKEHPQATDRLKYFLFRLDPFPKTFKVAGAPVVKGDKATASFVFEPVKLETGNAAALELEINKEYDARMFQTLLRQPFLALKQIDLVKEGEDWKLDVPVTPAFVDNVDYYTKRADSYIAPLRGFVEDLHRYRNVTKAEFEGEVLRILRESK